MTKITCSGKKSTAKGPEMAGSLIREPVSMASVACGIQKMGDACAEILTNTRIVFLQKNRCLPPFCCQKYQNVPK